VFPFSKSIQASPTGFAKIETARLVGPYSTSLIAGRRNGVGTDFIVV
jgi:hypothetical protein